MGYYTNYSLTIEANENFEYKPCKHDYPEKAKFCPECGVSLLPHKPDVEKILEWADSEFNTIHSSWEEKHFISDIYNGDADEMKWYEFKEDMLRISEKIKNVLFILHGEGEESGDVWTAYFKNGKVQMCQAQITYEPFDENKLV